MFFLVVLVVIVVVVINYNVRLVIPLLGSGTSRKSVNERSLSWPFLHSFSATLSLILCSIHDRPASRLIE